MGGSVGKEAKDILGEGAQVATLGLYNPKTGGVSKDNMVKNWIDGVSKFTQFKDSDAENLKMPVAEDPAIQEQKAKEIADNKLRAEIGEKGKGLSSTILGGSMRSLNDETLVKRKLLGE